MRRSEACSGSLPSRAEKDRRTYFRTVSLTGELTLSLAQRSRGETFRASITEAAAPVVGTSSRAQRRCPPPAPTTRTGTRPRAGDARNIGDVRPACRSSSGRCGHWHDPHAAGTSVARTVKTAGSVDRSVAQCRLAGTQRSTDGFGPCFCLRHSRRLTVRRWDSAVPFLASAALPLRDPHARRRSHEEEGNE